MRFTKLQPNSFYRASSPGELTETGLAQNLDTEICIIGGGFAGLATALSLVERGERNIVLLEAHCIGHGASGLNGGFVFGGLLGGVWLASD